MAESGSMTDASKRRLPDDPEWDDAELVMDAEDVARLHWLSNRCWHTQVKLEVAASF